MKSSDSATARILVADDQEDVLSALRLLLKSEGYRAETVNSPAKALAALEHREFDAVLIDLNYARDTTSGQEGLALLARIQALDSTLPVVVMTAWANGDLAVDAMRAGGAISSKSLGTTLGCSRSCERKWSWRAHCGGASTWKPKTKFSGKPRRQPSLPIRPLCGPSWI